MYKPWTIELLGGLRLRQGERAHSRFRSQKTGALLGYLALNLHREHSRDYLADLFWPEDLPEAARSSLRTALSALRRQLEPQETPEGCILSAGRLMVRLNPDQVRVDVIEYEALLREANRLEEGSPAQVERLLRAVELYQGDLMAGYYEEWVLQERERLSQMHLMTLQRLVVGLEAQADLAQAIPFAQQAVRLDPFPEVNQQTLLRLLMRAGQLGSAQRHYAEMERFWKAELGSAPSEETRALLTLERVGVRTLPARRMTAAAVAEPAPAPSAPAAPLPEEASKPVARAAPRLPLTLTRFFGRESEREQLALRLTTPETRLLTLTGPGGIGKTRLALELARHEEVQARFGAQITFVPLAEVQEAEHIPQAIYQALGGEACSDEEVRAVTLNRLRVLEQEANGVCLLLLDNFEHLAETGVFLVREMLQETPHLTCLVTSRQTLGLEGEVEFALKPLPVPAHSFAPERLLAFPSVQLFVSRAQAVQPAFQLSLRNAEAVARLCEHLEGIPLAIELAAAWARTLTPSQMLNRLTNRLMVLESQRRDIPERHRTLRATIEWSFRLLPEPLQQFFAALSVFAGGWTLEAAEAVCQEPGALEFLTRLQERSLLIAQPGEEEMRFHLLETLREYAQEQLETGERDALRLRHAEYYTRQAERAWEERSGPNQSFWLERLEEELENLRAILRWSLSSEGDPQFAIRLTGTLHWFWYVRGYISEGRRWLAEAMALQDPATPPFQRVMMTMGAGGLAMSQGDKAAARLHFDAAIAQWRALGDTENEANTLCFLGLVLQAEGEYAASLQTFEESLALSRRIGAKGSVAHVLKCLGALVLSVGEMDRAQEHFEESLALYRALEDQLGINMMLGELGQLMVHRGNYARAAELLEEHLELSRQLKAALHTGSALWKLGQVAHYQKDYLVASSLYRQALSILRELGNQWGIAHLLTFMADTALCLGDLVTARGHLEESWRFSRAFRDIRGVMLCLDGLAVWAIKSQREETAALLYGAADAIRVNEPGAPSDYPTFAIQYRQDTEAALGTEAFQTLYRQGQALSLDDLDMLLAL